MAITKKLLASPDPAVRNHVVRKNADGLTALQYAVIKNNTAIARFLSEIFYDMGERLNAPVDKVKKESS